MDFCSYSREHKPAHKQPASNSVDPLPDAGLSLRYLISKYRRYQLVFFASVVSVILTFAVMYAGFYALGIEVRMADRVVALVVPMAVASALTWILCGLVKRLDTLEKNMRDMLTYDQLTCVYTRRAFFDKVATLRLPHKPCVPFTILMLDLDHFKKVNDNYGHLAGDLALQKFCDAIKDKQRNVDLLGRFGGEEFIMLLWGADQFLSASYAQSVVELTRRLKVEYQDNTIDLSVSIGISETCKDRADIAHLISQADKALYAAKADGRDRFVKFCDL